MLLLVATADVTVGDGVWYPQVHVAQTTGHILTDGDNLPSAQLSLLQLLAQAGGHQLVEDY